MADALNMAINQVYHRVPRDILELAFTERDPTNRFTLPVHQTICNRVIVGRVLEECNVMGGLVKHIPLKYEYAEDVKPTTMNTMAGTNFGRIYRLPPSELEGSEIGDVLGICPPVSGSEISSTSNNGRTAYSMANSVLESMTGSSMSPRPMVEKVDGDMIRVIPANFAAEYWTVTVRLKYNREMSNLNEQAILPFCNLVVAAVKAYIYNTLYVNIDRLAMREGVEINVIRDIVGSYEPEEDRYHELLQQFLGGSTLAPATKYRLLQRML